MYRYSNGQISLADFKQPVGMNLKESNRWVKKAQTIPWLEIEKRYATLFTNRKGNVAKPLRLALGACIIQAEYGYSDEETALQIQENPYLQYFCGYPGYDDEKLPFDPSLMVYFRKRLTPEVLGEINEMILRDAKARQSKEAEDKDDDNSDDGSGAGGNSGTMIVDATCAPSNIRYPQDVSLLNEQNWTSVLWMGGRGWNAVPLVPTMKLGICRRWQNGSGSVKGIIPAVFWRTRSTGTVKISVIARSTESGSPARH